MTEDNRILRILNKDWQVLSDFSQKDLAIVQRLADLLKNPSDEVREISVCCLAKIGGVEAQKSFVSALNDPNEDVRNCSAEALEKHFGKDILVPLMRELKTNSSEFVREHVALVAGKIGDPAVIPELQDILANEPEIEVRENIALALARLGAKEYQNLVLNKLLNGDVQTRVSALKQFEYLHQPQLCGHLLPLLEDERDAINVAPKGHRQFVRICDLTISTLNQLLPQRLAFQVSMQKRYSTKEIASTKALINAILSPRT